MLSFPAAPFVTFPIFHKMIQASSEKCMHNCRTKRTLYCRNYSSDSPVSTLHHHAHLFEKGALRFNDRSCTDRRREKRPALLKLYILIIDIVGKIISIYYIFHFSFHPRHAGQCLCLAASDEAWSLLSLAQHSSAASSRRGEDTINEYQRQFS